MIYDPFDDPTLEVWPEGGAALVRKKPSVAAGLRLPTLSLVTLPPVNVSGEESRSEKPEAPGLYALAAVQEAVVQEAVFQEDSAQDALEPGDRDDGV